MKYLKVLHHNRTQKQFIHKQSIPNFFETLQRFAKLLLWVIWECFIVLINNQTEFGAQSVKINLSATLMFISMQKINFISNFFFWDVVQTL